MPNKELSNAIIAAADKDFSSFKDIVGNDLEQRFKDKIQDKTSTLAQQIFNPDFVPVHDEEEIDIDAELEDEKDETDELEDESDIPEGDPDEEKPDEEEED